MSANRRHQAVYGIAGGIALALTSIATPVHAEEVVTYKLVPQSNLKTIMADSVEKTGETATNSGPIERILDGKKETFWHSVWQSGTGKKEMPHYFIVGTVDGKPIPDVGQVVLGTRKSASGSGRVKDYQVEVRADGTCVDVPVGWEKAAEGTVGADDLADQEIVFKARPVQCVKVTYKSAWNGSKQDKDLFASLAEFNLGVATTGTVPTPEALKPTELKSRPLPAGVQSSGQILDPLALDNRRADNADKTPIALSIPGWNGKNRVVGARPSSTPKVAGENKSAGRDYHVDCQNLRSKPDGTAANPWNSVAQVNVHEKFAPGDRILFKRGTSCVGLVHPKGSGTAKAPISIDAYGDPAQKMPLIEGRGHTEKPDNDIPAKLRSQGATGNESAVIRLFNQENWVIRNLEITNYSGDKNDYSKRRRGVVIALEDYGRGSGFEVSDLYIHDVLGLGQKDLGGSGAIQFEAYAGAKKKPTSFAEIKVHHNTIRHVNRSGINEGSDFRMRPSVGGSIVDNPFEVWAPMEVFDNIVSDVGGDGIVTQFASGSKIYNNTVWNTSNHHGGRSKSGNNAAMWPWDADFVEYRNNHVFDTVMPAGTWDGTAFDADYGTTGTVFEYNVAHDNEGGFMLFCGCGGLSTKTVMRYNISINDGRGAENHAEGPRVFFVAGQTDGQVYNNTFLVYPGATLTKGASEQSAFTLANNVFLAQGAVKSGWDPKFSKTIPFRANLFAGTNSGWPLASDNYVVPQLRSPGGKGLTLLRFDRAHIGAKGYAVAPADTVDLANVPVASGGRPDLGALQAAPLGTSPLVRNGGFEDQDKGWSLSKGAAVVPQVHRGGKYGLILPGSEARARQEVQLGINQTYRLVVAVRPGDGGKLPKVSLKTSHGYEVLARPVGSAGANIAGTGGQPRVGSTDSWTAVSALARTSYDGATLTVEVSGSGQVDDIALVGVHDYMVDGSFQSFANTPWTVYNSGRTDDAVSGGFALSVRGPGASENPETVVDKTGLVYELTAWGKVSDSTKPLMIGVKGYGGTEKSVLIASTSYVQNSFSFTPSAARFTVYCYLPEGGSASCDDVMLTRVWDGKVAEISSGAQVLEPGPAASHGTGAGSGLGSVEKPGGLLPVQKAGLVHTGASVWFLLGTMVFLLVGMAVFLGRGWLVRK